MHAGVGMIRVMIILRARMAAIVLMARTSAPGRCCPPRSWVALGQAYSRSPVAL
jgi:hypothetical protein